MAWFCFEYSSPSQYAHRQALQTRNPKYNGILYSDEECRARYRFGKSAIEFIVNLVHVKINPPTKRSYSLSATKQC